MPEDQALKSHVFLPVAIQKLLGGHTIPAFKPVSVNILHNPMRMIWADKLHVWVKFYMLRKFQLEYPNEETSSESYA
jgi:hypothetical protein